MRCEFTTDRLDVAPWHDMAAAAGFDLPAFVTGLLTPAVTRSLPPDWQEPTTIERAAEFIADRDGESSVCAVVERSSNQPVGLLVLHAEHGVVHVGYLFAEASWGDGLASELVAALAEWARIRPDVAQLSAGVAADNPASARALLKCGFVAGSLNEAEVIYELEVTGPPS